MRVIVVRKLGLQVPFPSPFVSVVFGDRGSVLPMVLVKKLLRPRDMDAPVLGLSGALQGETKASAGKRCRSIPPRISMTDVLLRTQSTSYFNSMTVGLGCLQRRVAALSLV